MIGHLYLLGGGLILLGVAIAVCLRMSARRLRAEQVAEYGPAQVRGGLYRSRQVRR
ncbi:hypothetical protein ACIBCR_14765 [Micromonospora echinospora]|uniref:hypothetical protein n=1 Tax=Micromonospora echinospora TaxID=1877 RepID=UPI0037A0E96B